jgi:CBS domain-containing protein
MSAPLIAIPPDMDIKEAARLMFEKKIKKAANNRQQPFSRLSSV